MLRDVMRLECYVSQPKPTFGQLSTRGPYLSLLALQRSGVCKRESEHHLRLVDPARCLDAFAVKLGRQDVSRKYGTKRYGTSTSSNCLTIF